MDINRRTILGGLAASLVTGLSADTLLGNTKRYDVSYLWHSDLESVLDYMEEVERLLGPELAKKLHVVKGSKNFGLIYDRNGDFESTREVAQSHAYILRKFGLDGAVEIPDKGYEPIFNVNYGLGPNLDDLKANFRKVYSVLGEGVGKNLVIETTDAGIYALVYRRRGDKSSTFDAAQRHRELLKSSGIDASIIIESNNNVVYDESTFLDRGLGDVSIAITKIRSHPDIESKPFESELERQIERYIASLRREGKISPDERTAWSVYDFTNGEKLVSINEDEPIQAASMIKLMNMLAFFTKVDEGELKYGPKSTKYMEAMIQDSSNEAANWVMRCAGGPKGVQRILKERYGGIFRQTEVVEYIPEDGPNAGRTYRNQASAHDYSRFLYALWNNELPYSREMKRLMALPGRDRLYTGATDVPHGTLVYNKTGTTALLCGDAGILYARGKDGNRYAYTLIGIIEKEHRAPNFGTWTASRGNVIREVSNMTYKAMQAKHNLI